MKPVPMPPASAALQEAVDRALAPLRGRFSAETIEVLRQEALLQLAAHPYPAALVRALRTPVVQDSDVLGPEVEPSSAGTGAKGAA